MIYKSLTHRHKKLSYAPNWYHYLHKPIKLQHKLENIYIQDKTLDKILCLEFNF